VTWAWEYNPSEEFLTAGAPEAFIAEVKAKADELVRAAHALYLDGTTYQGSGEPMKTAIVEHGFFVYSVVPRNERVYILRLHAL
jgi:hypothetical protein